MESLFLQLHRRSVHSCILGFDSGEIGDYINDIIMQDWLLIDIVQLVVRTTVAACPVILEDDKSKPIVAALALDNCAAVCKKMRRAAYSDEVWHGAVFPLCSRLWPDLSALSKLPRNRLSDATFSLFDPQPFASCHELFRQFCQFNCTGQCTHALDLFIMLVGNVSNECSGKHELRL